MTTAGTDTAAKKTGKALAQVEQAELAELQRTLMDDEKLDLKDIILPKILLMQGLSKLVADSKAVLGEIRGSLDSNLLGNKDKPLEIIPIYIKKSWVILEEENGKFEYKQTIPWGPQNAAWEWDAITPEGKKQRRDQSLDVFVCLPSELNTSFMPYQVSFRRTSYTAGRKLTTAKEKFKMYNRPLASSTFMLSCKQDKNPKGVYYVYDISEGRATTADELKKIQPWFDLVKSTTIKVDDSDLYAESMPVSPMEAPEDFENVF